MEKSLTKKIDKELYIRNEARRTFNEWNRTMKGVEELSEMCFKAGQKNMAEEIFKEIEKIDVMDLWRFEVKEKHEELKKKFCEVKE